MQIYTITVKPFKGTDVNRALPSLHGGSLEVMQTVPLNKIILYETNVFISSWCCSSYTDCWNSDI